MQSPNEKGRPGRDGPLFCSVREAYAPGGSCSAIGSWACFTAPSKMALGSIASDAWKMSPRTLAPVQSCTLRARMRPSTVPRTTTDSATTSPLTAPGKVTFAGVKGSYGRTVEIDHGSGFRTLYGHMNSINVKVGQEVAIGSKVGTMGSTGRSTGPHLHYEIYFRGKSYDPLKFLRAGKHVH